MSDPQNAQEAMALAMEWAVGRRSHTNLADAYGGPANVAIMDTQEVVKWLAIAMAYADIDGPGTLPVEAVPESVLVAERARSAKLAEALREGEGIGKPWMSYEEQAAAFRKFCGIARAALDVYEEGEASDE